MEGLDALFELERIFLLWMSPVIFILSIVILLGADKYNKIEGVLGREIGGIRKRVVPMLETNIYSFHEWLLKKRVIVGLICVICSIVFLIVFKS